MHSDKTPRSMMLLHLSTIPKTVRLGVTKTGHQAKMFPLYDSVQSLNIILESVVRVVPELLAR